METTIKDPCKAMSNDTSLMAIKYERNGSLLFAEERMAGGQLARRTDRY